ncbi:hypothetical protein BJ875DRAFT_530189 [Amylocarpus encephaloides]|uniref:Uncharacterized protein n=1 Tax=Amylocarpus encephaloides TaxID=45428 RepID=A0A9P7Y525_9HELO|nr:hypothetical protein BJ875DRAFT_530189 [Amylocarpus encephaloides]
MLALIVKGVHLYNAGSHLTVGAEITARRIAHQEFSSKVNESLHGTNYSEDIREGEIIACLKKLMVERKHVIGDFGLVERSRSRRLTRAIKNAWNSNRKGNFTGSINEWENGRKEEVGDELRKEKGLPTVQEEHDAKKKAVAAGGNTEAEKVLQAEHNAEMAFQRRNQPQHFTSRLDAYHDPTFQVDLPPKNGFTGRNSHLTSDHASSYDAAFGYGQVCAPAPGGTADHGTSYELQVEYDPATTMCHFSTSRSPEPVAAADEMEEGEI